MSTQHSPTAVVFDIGRVLIDFSLDGFAAYLREAGAPALTPEQFIEQSRLREYELGQLSTQEFLDSLEKLTPQLLPRAELAARWQAIFSPDETMLELLTQTAVHQRVFLLSNTNELHWQYLDKEYRLSEQVEGVVTSYDAAASKPNPKIFLTAQQRHELEPEKTVFIDDIEQHVSAARELGWHGIHHTSTASTTQQLLQIGIRLA